MTHFAPDVLGSTIIVTQVGAHSDQDITYRGLPLRQRTVANVAAHETPNRATASLLRAGVQASELPPANVMQSARRKYLRRTNPALNNEVSMTQWLAFIQERAGRPLESLNLCDFIFVPNVRQEPPGLVVLITKADIALVRFMKEHDFVDPRGGSHRFAEVTEGGDGTFKVNREDWVLFRYAFSALRKGDKDDILVNTDVTQCYCWAPKENSGSLEACKLTANEFYASQGVDLWGWVKHAVYDDIDAGRQATQKCLEQGTFWRCLIHQLATTRKTSALPQKEWRGFVTGAVQALSHVDVTQCVFSAIADGILAHLVLCGRFQEFDYMRYHVLIWDSNRAMWDAEWRPATSMTTCEPMPLMCGRQTQPGHTTASVSQKLEKTWCDLKNAMPPNCAYVAIREVSDHLNNANTALLKRKGWIRPCEHGNDWEVVTDVNGETIFAPCVTWVSQRLLFGPAECSERLVYSAGEQIWIPPVKEFVAQGPLNYKSSTFGPLELDDVVKVFTVSMYDPTLHVTDAIHDIMVKILKAHDYHDLKGPFRAVKILTTEGPVRAGSEGISLTNAKLFFGSFASVTVLSHFPENFVGIQLLGHCWIQRRGQSIYDVVQGLNDNGCRDETSSKIRCYLPLEKQEG